MKRVSYNKPTADFRRLLRQAMVEKAPAGFTEKVMDSIVLEKEPKTKPVFHRPKTWIILSFIGVVAYLLATQLGAIGIFVRNNAYILVENLQQYFQSVKFYVILLQAKEWAGMLIQNLSELLSFSSFSSNLASYFVFIIPILLLILSQKLYAYAKLSAVRVG